MTVASRMGIAAGAFEAASPCGEQHDQRAQPLAPGVDDVVADLLDQGDAGRELPRNEQVDPPEVVAHQVEDAGEVKRRADRGDDPCGGTRSHGA